MIDYATNGMKFEQNLLISCTLLRMLFNLGFKNEDAST